MNIEGGSEASWCCACYELTFTSGAVAGKKMIVQATNTGGDLAGNQFDISVRCIFPASCLFLGRQCRSEIYTRYPAAVLEYSTVVPRSGEHQARAGERSTEASPRDLIATLSQLLCRLVAIGGSTGSKERITPQCLTHKLLVLQQLQRTPTV